MSGISVHYRPHSAILSFTAENVRSYSSEVHLSLLGTRLASPGVVRDLEIDGSLTPVNVLPVAGIFGANASGKSTLLRAMADMRNVVVNSFRSGDSGARMERYPFLLGETKERPSRFAIELVLHGVRWQYGFVIDDSHVLEEYAYHFPRGRQALVFRREQAAGVIDFGPPFRSSGRTLARLMRNNALLLSVAGAADDSSIGPLYSWFRRNLALMDSTNRDPRILATANFIQSSESRSRVLALLKAADLGIADLERVQPDLEPEQAERIQRAVRILAEDEDAMSDIDMDQIMGVLIRLHHMGSHGPIAIEPDQESQGTQAWLGLVGPVIGALSHGGAILVDELDTSLHPHLVQEIVLLFQDRETNPLCSQLIFNAHDTTILGNGSRRTLGRDQVWFTEKDAGGSTTLYPLSDFRPKNDDAVERRYLQGRYGGTPVLDTAGFRRAAEPAQK